MRLFTRTYEKDWWKNENLRNFSRNLALFFLSRMLCHSTILWHIKYLSTTIYSIYLVLRKSAKYTSTNESMVRLWRVTQNGLFWRIDRIKYIPLCKIKIIIDMRFLCKKIYVWIICLPWNECSFYSSHICFSSVGDQYKRQSQTSMTY